MALVEEKRVTGKGKSFFLGHAVLRKHPSTFHIYSATHKSEIIFFLLYFVKLRVFFLKKNKTRRQVGEGLFKIRFLQK